MSSSLDVEQLLVDDLQILGAPLTGAEHTNVCVSEHRRDFDDPGLFTHPADAIYHLRRIMVSRASGPS